MPALPAAFSIAPEILQRFDALVPASERSQCVQALLENFLDHHEKNLDSVSTEFTTHPDFAEARADALLWEATSSDDPSDLPLTTIERGTFETMFKAASLCRDRGLDIAMLALLYSSLDALAWAVYGHEVSCHIPDDHKDAYQTSADGTDTTASWTASAFCSSKRTGVADGCTRRRNAARFAPGPGLS